MWQRKQANNKNYMIYMIAAVAGLGGFLFGYDSSIIADTKDQISSQFSLSDMQWSFVVSVSLLGCMLGIPISGLFADRVSRKSMLFFVAISFMVGATICATATQLNYLVIGRFVIGICIGVASYISPLFIAEMSPQGIRGSMVLINCLAITFGQAFSFLIGYFLHDLHPESWRLLFWIGTIPASGLLIGIMLIPNSPRWVMMKYGIEQARQVLSNIRDANQDIQSELNEIQKNIQQSQTRFPISTLFLPPFVFVLIVGLGLGIFQPFSGINTIMYYGPVIFTSAGIFPIKNAILATFIMSMVNFGFTWVTFLLVDKWGRRFLLLSGTLIASLSLLMVACYFQQQWFDKKWIIFFFMATYIMGYCISLGSLFWVIISEIYPLNIRGFAMSIATVVQCGANFLLSISFLQLFHHVGEVKTFLLFSIVCLFAFLFVYYYVPETAGVSLEQIEDNLKKGKKLRELGVVDTPAILPGSAGYLKEQE